MAAGIVCTFASIFNFTNYATKESWPEVDLLRGTSAYLQSYQGETPKDALDYAQRTLAIVRKNEAFGEDAGKLEKELQEISTQIRESKTQSVYQPVLENIGEKIDDVLNDKARSAGSLPFGIATGALALLNFGLSAHSFCRKEE